ncbi:hypothetical protein [Nonomuraea sp. KM90]|uniref:hypothetical protein n=1 Tax=Nonomuraea sp. KM90 TaxID=3457428 RepID=UPI003FCCBACD
MTRDPAVLAYAQQIADDWGPFSAEELEVLSRVFAPRLRAVRAERAKNFRPAQKAA